MRIALSLIASVLLFLSNAEADAATVFNVTARVDRGTGEEPGGFPGPGNTLTIDIRLSGGVNVFALSASVWGYDGSIFEFVSGEAVSSINHAVAIPGVGSFSGMTNTLVPAPPAGSTIGTGPLVESEIGTNGRRIHFMNGSSATGTNTNALDPGLDGVIGRSSAQFRVVLRCLRFGTTTIRVGTGFPGDGEFLAGGVRSETTETVYVYSVIPEPGSALLLGVGLAGIVSARPRPSRAARTSELLSETAPAR